MSDQAQGGEKQSPFRRWLGKVKAFTGQYGQYQRVLIDNPLPTKLDKATNTQVPDTYNKGILLWLDNETGKKYVVKQLSVRNVSKKAAEAGFSASVTIDLDNEYEVQALE